MIATKCIFAHSSLNTSFLPPTTQVGSNRLFGKKIKVLSWKQAGIVTANLELKPPPYALAEVHFAYYHENFLGYYYLKTLQDALEPHMSRKTLEYHWGKHHRAYVYNLNKQTVGTELGSKTLEDIIISTYNKGDLLPPFNNAAQAWNHTFFWESMKPGGGGKPSGELLEMIDRDFGSFEEFVKEFKAAAATQFGSGWAWLAYKVNKFSVDSAANPVLVEEDKKLVVVKTPNAVNPLVFDYTPLLTVDVWEHAYYLDYQNRRPDYISIFMESLVSWEAVSERLEKAKAYVAEREAEEKSLREKVETKTAEADDTEEMYVDGSASEAE